MAETHAAQTSLTISALRKHVKTSQKSRKNARQTVRTKIREF